MRMQIAMRKFLATEVIKIKKQNRRFTDGAWLERSYEGRKCTSFSLQSTIELNVMMSMVSPIIRQVVAVKGAYRHHRSQGCTLEPRPASRWHEGDSDVATNFTSTGCKLTCRWRRIAISTHTHASQAPQCLKEGLCWAIASVLVSVCRTISWVVVGSCCMRMID